MGWMRTLFMGDIAQNLEIENIQERIDEMRREREGAAGPQKKQIEALQNEVHELRVRLAVLVKLLVAKNVGLFNFGVLAVLGEITCLVTAVVVLPAVLLLVRPQSSPRLPPFEWDKPTGVTAADVIPKPAPSPEAGS